MARSLPPEAASPDPVVVEPLVVELVLPPEESEPVDGDESALLSDVAVPEPDDSDPEPDVLGIVALDPDRESVL